ncbi:hypothetical protein Mzhil_0730 [Methanosalsum zhilinae DSM 4017]|uniref:Uncharacterized protein n=1 Tax=Methanosalsum zhilinae (strain DSM 4017 / NBRC 107636 / OCM 62 / WeN5) TaxID=679901 RepID=F7XKJ3_METZD|nr:hypothetical protein [Methanosalsum zhilinae]AEH60596.1 hypothetical protein Mzhil_0730 [Methanosalsum zhilinae DSM 4017]
MSKKSIEEIIKEHEEEWAKMSDEEMFEQFKKADKRAAEILGDE